jgi:hypothetical protein
MPGLPSAQIPLCESAVQAAGEQPLAAVHRVLRPRHAAQARLLPSRQPLQGSAAVLHFFVPCALRDDTCLPWQHFHCGCISHQICKDKVQGSASALHVFVL